MEEIKNKECEDSEMNENDQDHVKTSMENENAKEDMEVDTIIEDKIVQHKEESIDTSSDKDASVDAVSDNNQKRILSNLCDSDSDEDIIEDNLPPSNSDNIINNEDKSLNREIVVVTEIDPNVGIECSGINEEYNISASNNKNVTDNADSIESTTFDRNKEKRILSNLCDSDSDEDIIEDNIPPSNSDNIMNNEDKSLNKEIVVDTEIDPNAGIESSGINEESNISASNNENADSIKEKSILSNLCDPDSDEDLPENDSTENTPKPVPYKKKTKSKLESEDGNTKKMNAKEAIEQRKEIQSESQRMVRELNVSLPYHRPKQRSLRDFLKNRPKFADSVPVNSGTSPSMAIKMSTQQLETISKTLKEREKTVEDFFKSDSEESDTEIEQTKDNIETSGKVCEVKEIQADESKLDDLRQENSAIAIDLPENPVEEIPMEVETINDSQTAIDNSISNKTKDISAEYDFSLDDLEDEEENDAAIEKDLNQVELQQNDIVNGSVDTENNYDTTEMVITDDTLTQEKSIHAFDVALKERLANVTPRLSGGPNFVIDLDEGVTKPNAVTQLVERFIQHTSKKFHHHKSKVEMSVLSVTGGGEIHKEKVAVSVEDTTEPEIIEKPGLKLKKLRRDLEDQMAQRRSELWKQKQQNLKDDDKNVYEGETSVCGMDDIEMDDEEELILESDPECEDNDISDKPIVENNKELTDNESDEDDNADDNEEEKGSSDDESGCEEDVKLKTRKRIINILDDDSEEESNDKDSKQLDSTVSWDDENSPLLGQRMAQGTPQRPKMESNGELLLTPINNLTGLQSLNSGSKFLHKSLGSPIIKVSSPQSISNNWSKKLFSDSEHSSAHMEEIADICSGKFQTQTQRTTQVDSAPSEVCSTQELLDICSGNFTGLPDKTDKSEDTCKSTISEEPSNTTCVATTCSSIKEDNISSQDVCDHDKLISQLIDEDELEEFKKKFISPVKNSQQPQEASQQSQEVTQPSHTDFDSSDDEWEIQPTLKNKVKYNAILDSDDEDKMENVKPKDIDSNKGDTDDDIAEDVAYDSEENEVDTEKPAAPKMKIADFFENEAELSESEWGSEDEDEKNLDTLEFELGDTEKLDENKIHRDLEKIHMRRILDDDTREVKILQEMLLEDGELHGAGRQKQFRWKNNAGENETEPDNTEDTEKNAYEEDENEEEWRKKRFERDLFLKKNGMSSQQDENDDITLGLNQKAFKLGDQTILNRTSNNGPNGQQVKISQPKQLFLLNNKRGSFLTRNDQVLSRVAEYANNSAKIGTGKSSTKIVFQTIDENAEADNKKRKMGSDGTPMAIKKLRLNNFSPAAQNKSNLPNSRKKSLFNT